jgi:FixJ family two-component response regulator
VGLTTVTFPSGQEFLDERESIDAGAVLLDVRMPGMSGLELQEHLRVRGVDIPVILITGHADVSMAVRAMKSGAFDFIEKPFNDQQLLDRVQRAMQEGRARGAEKEAKSVTRRRLDKLSPRERTVMDLVVAGKSNKEVAIELGLSQKTVEVHRAHVMSKTGVSSLAELVRLAIAAG